MIFTRDLADLVLTGRKTQTRRRFTADKPCRYHAGRTYAVQEGRGKPALGRIRVLIVEPMPVANITRRDARLEGFKSPRKFLARWEEMHGTTRGWCWCITFELAEAG